MISSFYRPILAAIGIFLVLASARADEGMWLFHQPPRELLKEKYKFELGNKLLDRLQKATVCFGKNGSGAFVSADGLLLTNHHVALKWLEELAAERKDLVADGYYASRQDQELRCPGLELYVVCSSEDVTARVQASLKPGMTMAEAAKARRQTIHAIEAECGVRTGLHGEVIGHHAGAEYQLYRHKKHSDVRLVFAPGKARLERGVAAPDPGFPAPPPQPKLPAEQPASDMYITDAFDVCFFRVYDKGKPFRSVDHLTIASKLSRPGDLVLMSGFPGTTNRFSTSAELEELLGRSLLVDMKAAVRDLAVLEDFAKENPREAHFASSNIAATNLAMQDAATQMQKKHIVATRRRERAEQAKLLATDRELAQKQRQALKAIDQANLDGEMAKGRLQAMEALCSYGGSLFQMAVYLVRATVDPSDNAWAAAATAELAEGMREGFFAARPVSKKLEAARLAEALELFTSRAGADRDLAEQILGGKSAEACAAAAIKGTTLHQLSVRLDLLKGGARAVADSQDPVLVLARLFEKRSRQAYLDYDAKVLEPSRQAHAALLLVRKKTAAGPIYPDAAGSLRLSFGAMLPPDKVFRGEQETTVLTGISTLQRLFDLAKLPGNWQEARSKLKMRVPLNLDVSADGTGGSSGSPVVDRDGRVVGIMSTGPALGSHEVDADLRFDEETNHGGIVCTAAILEALEHVYAALPLVKELGGNPRLEIDWGPHGQTPQKIPSVEPIPPPFPAKKMPTIDGPPPIPPPLPAKKMPDDTPPRKMPMDLPPKQMPIAEPRPIPPPAFEIKKSSVVDRHKELVPALIKSLNDEESEVVEASANALGRIGAAAIPALIEAAESKNSSWRLRAHAALALGKMGPAAQSAIPTLLRLLQDHDPVVRRQAARALATVVD